MTTLWCLQISTWANIIGMTQVLTNLLQLIPWTLLLINGIQLEIERKGRDDYFDETITSEQFGSSESWIIISLAYTMASLIFAIIGMVSGGLLIYGTHQKNSNNLTLWMILTATCFLWEILTVTASIPGVSFLEFRWALVTVVIVTLSFGLGCCIVMELKRDFQNKIIIIQEKQSPYKF